MSLGDEIEALRLEFEELERRREMGNQETHSLIRQGEEASNDLFLRHDQFLDFIEDCFGMGQSVLQEAADNGNEYLRQIDGVKTGDQLPRQLESGPSQQQPVGTSTPTPVAAASPRPGPSNAGGMRSDAIKQPATTSGGGQGGWRSIPIGPATKPVDSQRTKIASPQESPRKAQAQNAPSASGLATRAHKTSNIQSRSGPPPRHASPRRGRQQSPSGRGKSQTRTSNVVDDEWEEEMRNVQVVVQPKLLFYNENQGLYDASNNSQHNNLL